MKSSINLLCLGTYPVESAAARYRVLQFFPYLRAVGIEASFHPFMDSRFFRDFYKSGYVIRKLFRLWGFTLRRCIDVAHSTSADVVLIHREAALWGPPLFEAMISRVIKKPLVFDFDDAIHVSYVSPTYGRLAGLLKYPQKTPQTIRWSKAVIAGNRYLQEYAATLNTEVTLIPTVVDSNLVQPVWLRPHSEPSNRDYLVTNKDFETVIGWIGTHGTYPYLQWLFPILQEVAKRHPIILRVVGAGQRVNIPGVKVDNRQWRLETEITDLQSFDIGLYPILEDQLSPGKSGFKAIQYMAVGIPTVCSPVGATCDIIENGVHGFLPVDTNEWVEKLCQLIKDSALRQHMGKAGRARVEEASIPTARK